MPNSSQNSSSTTRPILRNSDERPGRDPLPTWEGIPQIVPSSWCFACDVCCRFPEKDSFLAPYFTRGEIEGALREGISSDSFSGTEGCKIALTPHGEGCLCPAFSPEDAHCRIYAHRPFDCRIYPFALMHGPSGEGLLLGIDLKCPFARETAHERIIAESAERLASLLGTPPFLEMLRENPGLVNRWQDDVVVLKEL